MRRALKMLVPAMLVLAPAGTALAGTEDTTADTASDNTTAGTATDGTTAGTSGADAGDRLVVNGPPEGSGDGPASGEPIRFGAITSLSGIATFPESAPAAQAVFDRYNEQGGLDGRPIELVVEDDGADAAKSATVARTMVEDNDVVAMVAGASLLSCAAAGQYLADNGVFSLLAVGVDPVCFNNDHISATNTGPFINVGTSLVYASENLGIENNCFLTLNIPDFVPVYRDIVAQWEDATGKTLTSFLVIEPQDDPTNALTSARSAGCESLTLAMVEPIYLSYIQAAVAGGFNEDFQIMMQTSGYSSTLAEALGPDGEGIPSQSEYEPYTGECECLDDFKALMEENDLALSSFAQAGYLSASLALTALESIEGDITRESVGEAFQALDVDTEWLADGFVWGPTPSTATKPVVIRDGAWVPGSDDDEWVHFPPQG